MSIITVQFDAIGPIPLYPNSVSVIDRATKDITTDQPSGSPASNILIPRNAVITEIVVRRAINPSLTTEVNGKQVIDYSVQTPVTPNAIIKLGIVGDETKYTPVISFVTNELNKKDYILYQPDPPLILRPDDVPLNPIDYTKVNDIVLTAGFADIDTGFVSILVKYIEPPAATYGLRKNTTTVL
jgi:hypothetical protein